jgi:heterodisulfide reductase subunit C
MYPEYMPGIRKILDHYHLKENADRIIKEREG